MTIRSGTCRGNRHGRCGRRRFGNRCCGRGGGRQRCGKRFTNEAANYNAFGAAFHEQDTNRCSYVNLPCWVIFNQEFYEKYGFADGLGGEQREHKRPPQWITGAETLVVSESLCARDFA
jgi:hypothetical protein